MKVMFDTNVLLDALLEREPYAKTAAKLLGAAAAKKLAQRLLKIFDLATVDRVMLQAALGSPDHDFEDAVLCESAYYAGAVAIVTRNTRDFQSAPVRVYLPEALLTWLQRQSTEE
jgi:predicted nucleic acid-binding protein